MLLCSSAIAVVTENSIDPAAEKFIFSTSVLYVDNYHPRQIDHLSATALSGGFSGKIVSMRESLWVQAGYSGNFSQFNLDENELALEDQFSHYSVDLLGRLFVGRKWYIDLQGVHTYVDHLPGTDIAKFRAAAVSGDSKSTNKISASVVYGSGINNSRDSDTRRFIRFGLSHLEQDYADNNFYSSLYDLTRDLAEIGFSYKLSDISQFETSLQYEKVDFIDDLQLDNDIYRALIGFNWQGTGQTYLKLLVGGYKRDYQLGPDRQGFLAELDTKYTPQDNLSVELKASQRTTAGLVENSLDTIVKSAQFAISYGYKEHIEFVVSTNLSSTEYQQTGLDRTSEESAISILTQISIYEHSKVGLVVRKESLEDDDLGFDYVQNKVELNWSLAF